MKVWLPQSHLKSCSCSCILLPLLRVNTKSWYLGSLLESVLHPHLNFSSIRSYFPSLLMTSCWFSLLDIWSFFLQCNHLHTPPASSMLSCCHASAYASAVCPPRKIESKKLQNVTRITFPSYTYKMCLVP